MKSTKSIKFQKHAKQVIPGMTQLLSKRPDMFAPGVWPGYYSKARGVEVWDLDGNHFIDMSIAGIGANVLGYADPDVNQAVKDAIENGTSCSLNCPEEVELADLFCELHPWAEMVRFTRAGGEAMTLAVRIARAFTVRDKLAFCGYHGWHDWYLAANLNNGSELDNHLITGLEPNGVPKGLANTAFPFRYNKIEELKAIVEQHGSELAAIVMEPIRNQQPIYGFFEEIQLIAKDIGAILIIDEISAGFRTNPGGAHLNFDIVPDIAVFSKGIGNGFPIAAIIGKAAVMQAAQSTFISSTMWTERVGPVAALATIKKFIAEDVHKHLIEIGAAVQNGWENIAQKHLVKLKISSGVAPLAHFTFDYPNGLEIKSLFVQMMLERGFLASNLFYASYAHSLNHVKAYLEAFDEVMAILSELIQVDGIVEKMEGKPATKGFKRLS